MNREWVNRILKIENDLTNWKQKVEADRRWKKSINNWIFNEFGFDIENTLKREDEVNDKVTHITFSTGQEELDFGKLKDKLNLHVNKLEPLQTAGQTEYTLACLPATTQVFELNRHSASSTRSRALPHLIITPAVEEDMVQEDDYEGVDYTADDDDSEFPLSLYDLEGDEEFGLQCDVNPETVNQNEDQQDDVMSKNEDNEGIVDYENENDDDASVELAYTTIEPADDPRSQDKHENIVVSNGAENNNKKRGGRVGKSLIQNISEPGQVRFQCRACGRTFSDRGNGHRHVRRIHNKEKEKLQDASRSKSYETHPPILKPQVDVIIKEEKLDHSGVGRLSTEQRKQAAKLIRRLGNKWECKKCKRTFSVSCNARRHARVVHFGERLYECRYCEKQFSSKTDGVIHEKSCETRQSKGRASLSSGMLKNDGGKNEPIVSYCEIVQVDDPNETGNDQNKNREKLAVVTLDSLATRRPNGQLQCKLCSADGRISCFSDNALFSRHAYLSHHKRISEQRGSFSCQKCSRTFSSEVNLKAHHLACTKRKYPKAMTATTRAVFISSTQQVPKKLRKTYSPKGRVGQLSADMLNQGLIQKIDGAKPYFECKVCHNRYSDLKSVWTHCKRMHLTAKPFKCTKCPKSYFNRKDFLKHEMKCIATPQPREEVEELTVAPHIPVYHLDLLSDALEISEVDEADDQAQNDY